MGTSDAIELADRHYHAREWAAALAAYQGVAQADPPAAVQCALPMAIGHCLVELADDDPPDLHRYFGHQLGWEAHAARISHLRVRAAELAGEGDFARASRLLRFLAGYDGAMAQSYSEGMLGGRTAFCDLPDAPPSDAPPAGMTARPVTDAMIASCKARAAGMRLLVVRERLLSTPAWQYGLHQNMARAGRAFGMTTAMLELPIDDVARAGERFVAGLQRALAESKPDLIFFDNLLHTGSSADPAVGAQVEAILHGARETQGCRVFSYFTDIWMVPRETVYRGLGTALDVVNHVEPQLLSGTTDAERTATLCYPPPWQLPASSVAPGEIPRVGFAGSVNWANPSRLFWWAELGRLGFPLDFIETQYGTAGMRSDQGFTDLLRRYQIGLSLTRRQNGSGILTSRTMEVPLAGGCLLEEDAAGTRHFMIPGVHYQPFHTLADLIELVPRLLRDHAYRRRLATEGHAWALQHLTGDYFWTMLFEQLDALAGRR